MGKNRKLVTYYSEEEYFKEECVPLLKQLLKKCGARNIPCFFTAAVSNEESGTKYVTDGIMTGSRNIGLKTDRIKHHMMIADGCVAKPAAEKMEFPTDMLLFGDFVDED